MNVIIIRLQIHVSKVRCRLIRPSSISTKICLTDIVNFLRALVNFSSCMEGEETEIMREIFSWVPWVSEYLSLSYFTKELYYK